MCNYQGYEFGAGRYPDSVCMDGRLLDADQCDAEGNIFGYPAKPVGTVNI